MRTTTVEGFIASADRISANGWVSLTEDTIRSFVDEIRRNGLPVVPSCAEAVDLPVRVLAAEVRRTPSGGLGIWVSLEVPAERWGRIGDLRLFSLMVTNNIREPASASSKPTALVYADVQHFPGRLLPEAFRRLAPGFNVGGGPLYQYVVPSLPRVLVVLHSPGPALSAEPFMGDVTSAAELFLRPKVTEPTQFVVVVARPDGGRQKAIICTRQQDALGRALAAVPSRMTADQRQVLFFDEGTGWLEH